MAQTYIVLLRGVNVGGKNKLAMDGLRRCFVEVGGGDVRTYIQSGNVVFEAETSHDAVSACAQVEAAIHERFSCKSPLILRSAPELAASVEANPFLSRDPESNPAALHVVFLADMPDPSRAAMLDPAHSPGDEFALIGREIYLRLPRGVAETKLTIPYFDSKLKTTGTQRNWRTVAILAGMASEA